MTVRLRPVRPEDADITGRICFEAFSTIAREHGFPSDVPVLEAGIGLTCHMVSRRDVYGVVAERDGRVIGSNFMWEQSVISGIGPISVDPAVQNGGAGRALMEDALQRARSTGAAGVRLVQAAYHNRSLSLYTRLGFDTREPLSVMQGPPVAKTLPGRAVRPAVEADVPACEALSQRIHGFSRGPELRDGIAQGTASVVIGDGRITGYASAVGFFGHSSCETDEDLKALIAAAPAFPGPGFLLPTRNAAVFRWCLDQGLRVVEPMTLMSLGLYNAPAGAFMPSIFF